MNDFTDFIQQVKRANDIVDVIGSYLELRRSGTTYLARCPFHGEKTPSFNVNPRMQFYHCFGCGESGDVIGFVQKYESCTFMEALEILAKRAGLKMPENANADDKKMQERKAQKDTFLDILRETARFYYRCFRGENGKRARDYMANRGFDDQTVNKFGIGYSPDAVSLPAYLKAKGFRTDDCVKCGVLAPNGNDALRGRLIVPIFSMAGKVIAFGGRAFDEKTMQYGKYKNTTETPVFSKKDNLFALNIAKEQKQQTQLPNIVIVEGYMDVIAMYQYGFCRAVASMGTSLTAEQAKLLSRLTSNVYVCYDADSSGQKATVRGMDILDKAGLDVKVMSVPRENGVKDPDEFIKKYGKEAFEQLIDSALPLPDYKLKLLDEAFNIKSSNASVRNDALAKYVKGAVKMLHELDDVRQTQYISVVASKTGYSEDYLRRKVNTYTENSDKTEEKSEQEQSKIALEDQAKYFVASCILANEDYADLDVKPTISTPFLANLYQYIFECKSKGEKPSMDMLYTVCANFSQEEYNKIIGNDFSKANYSKNKRYYEECVVFLKEQLLRQQRDSLTASLATAENVTEIYKQIEDINKQISELR